MGNDWEPEFPDPDEDEFDDFFDEEEDEEEEPPYLIFWLSLAPVDMDSVGHWEAPNHVVVEAHGDEAYVYWERDETAVEKAQVAFITLERSFKTPYEQVWDFVQDEGHIKIKRTKR